MTQNNVQKFMNDHKGYFSPDCEQLIYQSLLSVDDETADNAMNVKLRNPKTMKLISFFLGVFGIDRLINGDIIGWIFKEGTLGFFLIGWFVDFINAEKITQGFNSARLLVVIYPGKITKPTMLANLKNSWKNDPKFRKELLNSITNVKNSASGLQDTMYLH